jgi:hypothetical protein
MGFLDHTQRRTIVSGASLDQWSARRIDLYLTIHNTHRRQTSIPPAGFEPTISVSERPQTYALDRAATGTDTRNIRIIKQFKLKDEAFLVTVLLIWPSLVMGITAVLTETSNVTLTNWIVLFLLKYVLKHIFYIRRLSTTPLVAAMNLTVYYPGQQMHYKCIYIIFREPYHSTLLKFHCILSPTTITWTF